MSCATSTSCHQNGAFQHPFLGPGVGTTPTSAQIAAIRAELVGVKALEFPSADLVSVNDPANSWMMLKLDSSTISCSCPSNSLAPACGLSMPQSSALLAPDKRAIIRDWIKTGAAM